MSCFKPSLCTEERERGGGVTGKGERGTGNGEREREWGGRDRWGGWNGKGEKGKGRGGERGIGGVAGMENGKREGEGEGGG
jgi:hypothetical protein